MLFDSTLVPQDPDPIHGNLWALKVPLLRVPLARGQQEQPAHLSPLLTAHLGNPPNDREVCQDPTCATFGQVNFMLLLILLHLLILLLILLHLLLLLHLHYPAVG